MLAAPPQYANEPKKLSELAWHIGMTSSAPSSRWSESSISVTSERRTAALWLRTTPFGLPVVPEVYISVHGSDGEIPRWSGSASLERTAGRLGQGLVGSSSGG